MKEEKRGEMERRGEEKEIMAREEKEIMAR